MTAPQERRRHPRVGLFASVEVRTTQEVLVLDVRNLSLVGVLVAIDDHRRIHFPLGSRHELVIFTPGDDEKELVVHGQVARYEPGAVAFKWREDDTSTFRLAALVCRATAKVK